MLAPRQVASDHWSTPAPAGQQELDEWKRARIEQTAGMMGQRQVAFYGRSCIPARLLTCACFSLTYLLTDSRICLSLASLLAGGGGENLGRRGAHRGTLATTTRGAEGAQGHAAPSCSFMCPRLQPYGTRL
jgi:hypothetical protein